MLFRNITIVDENFKTREHVYVGTDSDTISYISEKEPEKDYGQIFDGENRLLIPAFYNLHGHVPMTLMRGFGENLPLMDWLQKKIFPFEAQLTDEDMYNGAMLGIAEMLRYGIGATTEIYLRYAPLARALAESGIKANLSRSLVNFGEEFDFEKDPRCQEAVALHEKWHGYDNGRILVESAIHGEYTSDYRLWDAVSEYTINNGLGMQVHISETKREHDESLERNGLTPAQVLNCHHVFDTRTVAAHCVWIDEEDRKVLGAHHVTAVHNPVSNLKLASGCADVLAMIRDGMNVALGTDGDSSNNNLDMFEEMKAAALTANMVNHDPNALPAAAVLTMGTVCGAKAQGREKECGQIRVGMDADLILLDFTQPHLMPCHDVMSNLVFSARGSDVVMTMVRGKILYMDGQYPTIDMNAVVRELGEYVIPHIFSDED